MLDLAVEAALGKAAPRGSGMVVVGTQTLEISLDIDADLMIADLAPADVLLQRLGRLHRHARPRPAGYETPQCLVLVPDDFEMTLASVMRERLGGPHGFGSVYANVLALEATRRLVGEGTDWSIPGDNRRLVESATHGEALSSLAEDLAAVDSRWREAWNRNVGGRYAMNNLVYAVRLEWDRPVSQFKVDEDAATRLGTRDVEVEFEPARPGPFGHLVHRLVVPVHLNPSASFEPANVVSVAHGFMFDLGDQRFVYDNYGLRRRDGSPVAIAARH